MARINLFYLVSFDLNYDKSQRGIRISNVQWHTRHGKRKVRVQASHNRIPKNTDSKPGDKSLLQRFVKLKPRSEIIDKPRQEPRLDSPQEVTGQKGLEARLTGFLTHTSPDFSAVKEDIHQLHSLFPDSEEQIKDYFTGLYQKEGEQHFRAGFAKALILLEQGKEGEYRKLFRGLQAEMDQDLFNGMVPEKVAMVSFLDNRLKQLRRDREQRRASTPGQQTRPESFVDAPEPGPLDLSGTPDELRGRAKKLVDQEDFASAEKLLNHLISLPPGEDNDRRSSHVINAYRMGKQAQSGKFLGTASADALRELSKLLQDYQKCGYWSEEQIQGLKKLEEVISKLWPGV